MIALVLAGTAQAACPERPPANALADLLNDATVAYQDLDIERFQKRTDEVRAQLPCVADLLPPYLVARLHRTEGLRAFGDRQDWAAGAFAAARAIEPDYSFPTDLIPENHPVRDAYRSMPVQGPASEAVPRPAEGEVWVDGRSAESHATDRPVVFQRADGAGVVVDTRYLLPGSPWPTYAPFVPPVEVPEEPVRTARHRGPLLAASVGTGLVAGGAWMLAATSHRAFHDPSTADADLPALRRRTNGATVAAGSTGALAVALGVTTVVAW